MGEAEGTVDCYHQLAKHKVDPIFLMGEEEGKGILSAFCFTNW
jgi:hypothetical protein